VVEGKRLKLVRSEYMLFSSKSLLKGLICVCLVAFTIGCGKDDEENNQNHENNRSNYLGHTNNYHNPALGYDPRLGVNNRYGLNTRGYYNYGYRLGRRSYRPGYRANWTGYGWNNLNYGLNSLHTHPSPNYALNYGFAVDLTAFTKVKVRKSTRHRAHAPKFSSRGVCDEPLNFNLAKDVRVSLNEHAFQSEFAGKKLVLESADILLTSKSSSGDQNFLRGHYDGKNAKLLCHTAESCLNSDREDAIRAMMKLPETIDLAKNEDINVVEMKFETDGYEENAFVNVKKSISAHKSFLTPPSVKGAKVTPSMYSIAGEKMLYISKVEMTKSDGTTYEIKYMGTYKVK
jgi:hypothetical protein